MTRFAIIGAAGYIAPRHMKAITDLGSTIVAACDVHDAVGVLDAYAPECRFTTEPTEFFDRHLHDVDIVTICTPNHLHATHAQRALEMGCDVVLEKPLATHGDSAALLADRAKGFRNRVFPVIQLRYHPDVIALREAVRASRTLQHCEIDYATYRGPWYDRSWKGREAQSGGLVVNLGVHLFDLCMYVFGPLISVKSAIVGAHEASGTFRCEKATIRWRLSCKSAEQRRVFRVMGKEIDLSNRLKVLHATVYEEVLAGRGFGLEDAAEALRAIDRVKDAARTAEARRAS